MNWHVYFPKLSERLLIWNEEIDMDWSYENYDRRNLREYGTAGYGHEGIGPQPDIPRWLYVMWYYLPAKTSFNIRCLICKWRGHDIVSNGSYASPESAVDYFECRRCGGSWSHVYY